MKFNFFVLIVSLMIHFIAQAGNGKKAVDKQLAPVKAERTVASGEANGEKSCDCAEKN